MSLTDKMGDSLGNISACDISGAIGGVIGGVGGSVENNSDKPKLYDLSLVSSNGVFCKYKVDNFTVSNENVKSFTERLVLFSLQRFKNFLKKIKKIL